MMLRFGAVGVCACAWLGVVLSWTPVGVLAATPVEDRSAADVQPTPIRTPQPLLPEELSGPARTQGAAGDAYPRAGMYPGSDTGTPGTGEPVLRGGQTAQMFYEIQQLQTEVLQLRGMLEEQAFEIRRLRELQRSQYLDIDRRLTGAGAPGAASGPDAGSDRALGSAEAVAPGTRLQLPTTPQPVVESTPTPAAATGRIVVQTAAPASRSAPVTQPSSPQSDGAATEGEVVVLPSEQGRVHAGV